MKQRINLYAAGCALLILLCFFLIPFYSYEVETVDFGGREYKEYWSYERGYYKVYADEVSQDANASTLGFIETYELPGSAQFMILIVPLCALLLLISGLFIDRKTSLGMSIGATIVCILTFVLVLISVNEGQSNSQDIAVGAGGIICCVLFIVYCLLEGFRDHLPGYRANRSRKVRPAQMPQYAAYPAYGYPPQGQAQAGYPQQPYPRQDPGYAVSEQASKPASVTAAAAEVKESAVPPETAAKVPEANNEQA